MDARPTIVILLILYRCCSFSVIMLAAWWSGLVQTGYMPWRDSVLQSRGGKAILTAQDYFPCGIDPLMATTFSFLMEDVHLLPREV